jgi:hypothetical protein
MSWIGTVGTYASELGELGTEAAGIYAQIEAIRAGARPVAPPAEPSRLVLPPQATAAAGLPSWALPLGAVAVLFLVMRR